MKSFKKISSIFILTFFIGMGVFFTTPQEANANLLYKFFGYIAGVCGIGQHEETTYPQAETVYDIENAIVFDGSTDYLSRTFTTPTTQDVFTLSFWMQRSRLDELSGVFSAITTNKDTLYFNSTSNTFKSILNAATVYETPGKFRDTSEYFHAQWVQNGTAASFYVDGSLVVTGTGTPTYINSAIQHTLGSYNGAANFFSGYMSDVRFIDGQALAPTDFGYEDEYGKWQPKAYAGGYGTNGFYLDFSNSSNLGADRSGNGNDWTVNGSPEQVASTPTNTYVTWDPLNHSSGATFVNGNKQGTVTASQGEIILPSIAVSGGKYYAEIKAVSGFSNGGGSGGMIGISNVDGVNPYGTRAYYHPDSFGYYYYDGKVYTNSAGTTYGDTYTDGDIIGVILDMDTGAAWLTKNGVLQKNATVNQILAGDTTNAFASGLVGNYGPALLGGGATSTVNLIASESDWTYTAPAGFKALSTKNLSTSTIKKPNEQFEVLTYTGNGSTQTVTGTDWGAADQLVWVKNRDSANSYILSDTLRGANHSIFSDGTWAEDTIYSDITAFNNNGFAVGTETRVNGNGHKMVAWRWKAGDSQVTNTDGTITSTVSANSTSKFSIVKYTGNGVAGSTIGHGLGTEKIWVIVKNLTDGSTQWVHNPYNALGVNYYGYFNTGAFTQDSSNVFWYNPTPTTFGISAHNEVNGTGKEYIAYIWAELEGFSKFGKYTGNGSTDGPFVYTGFKPAYVMVKNINSGSQSWVVHDLERDPYNPAQNRLVAENAYTEGVTIFGDFLSNGFKLRTSDAGRNASGQTFIYMVFAEEPLKVSADAKTATADYTNSGDYSFEDGTKLQVANGVASLKNSAGYPVDEILTTVTNDSGQLNIAGAFDMEGVDVTETKEEVESVGNSLLFDGGSDYLTWTPEQAGDQKKWTWSGWVKRTELSSAQQMIFSAGGSYPSDHFLRFTSSDEIQFTYGATNYLTTSAKYRDSSGFMHISFIWDTANATSSDRLRLYVDGVRVTSFSSASYPTQNTNSFQINQAVNHNIGMYTDGSNYPLHSYMSDIYFVDGQAIDPTSFGQTEAATGKWVPKAYSGEYGTNGFHLDFSNQSRLGDDAATHDGDGYATWNPYDKGASILSNNNLTYYGNSVSDHCRATIGMKTGKWYWEVRVDNNTYAFIGFANQKSKPSTTILGADVNGWGYYVGDGNLYHGTISGFASAASVGDIIGIEFDADAGSAAFYKQGVLMNTITGLDTSDTYFAATGQNYTDQVTAVFKDSDWTYTPTAGFKALNVNNLPTPSTYNTNEHFEVLTYTGTGTELRITGTDWGNDDQLVWIKQRDKVDNHVLFDSVRGGGTQAIYTNSTRNEVTPGELASSNGITYNSDGFTLGSWNNINQSGINTVAWRFRAGTSAVNNDGTISATVSHNPTLGFSIVKANGVSLGGSIGHGGAKTPAMIIAKRLDSSSNWTIWDAKEHGTSGITQTLYLNLTNANDTTAHRLDSVDATKFTLGPSTLWTGDWIFYVFFESDLVKPFSYTGNGSVDGPFVNTGGEPLFILRRPATTAGAHWLLFSKKQNNGSKTLSKFLETSTAGVEQDVNYGNTEDTGFKVTTTNSHLNGSSVQDVGFAIIGQQPQKTLTGNDFNVVGSPVQTTDVPTNTYATLNPLNKNSGVTLSEGNLLNSAGAIFGGAIATLYITETPVYWEMRNDGTLPSGSAVGMGIANKDYGTALYSVSSPDPDGVSFYADYTNLYVRVDNSYTVTLPKLNVGDILRIAVDATNSKIWLGLNGVWFDASGNSTGDPENGLNPTVSGKNIMGWAPWAMIRNGSSKYKFAESDWTYAAPTGFKALSTTNLPTPTDKLSNHFETLLYTGNGTSQTITGTDWGDDDQLVWVKGRTFAGGHRIFDSIRGENKWLASDSTVAETTDVQSLTGLTSNSFSIGNEGSVNNSGSTYTAWRFRAGQQAANTDGTIDATVSANTTSGFSIVKYTGNGVAGATIGHGLGKKPGMMIVKRTDGGSGGWYMYHKDLGATKTLEMQAAAAAQNYAWTWNNTEPDANVFSVGSDVNINGSGNEYIAYIFTDSDFIDIGSYTGNGSTDGPFVYTNGAPQFALIKSSGAGTNWWMHDGERDSINPSYHRLLANSSAVENTSQGVMDVNSSGIKIRYAQDDVNYNNNQLNYLVFKEPLGSQNANQKLYYAVSFDDRTIFKTWDSSASAWRNIAQVSTGTWQYNSAASGAETWTNCTSNDQEDCLSQAFGISTNQMIGTTFESLTDSNFNETGGWTNSSATIDVAIGMSTNTAVSTPSVDSIEFTYVPRDTQNTSVPYTVDENTTYSSEDVSKIQAEGGVAKLMGTAQLDPEVKLLIHSDTTNGSTTFTDSSGKGHVITPVGNTNHSTTQQKFGTSGMYFDGTGDYLSIPDSSDWSFGSGDFTIDAWVKRDAINTWFPIVKQGSGSPNDDPQWSFYVTSSNIIYFYHWQSSTSLQSTATITDTNWHHIAAVRNGTSLKIYIDGVSVGEKTAPTFEDRSYPLIIGQGYLPSSLVQAQGYLDEFRIVKGKALWTSNFTPPTLSYGSFVGTGSGAYETAYATDKVYSLTTSASSQVDASNLSAVSSVDVTETTASTDYEISKSAYFSGSRLERTFAQGDQKTWTISMWVKDPTPSVANIFFGSRWGNGEKQWFDLSWYVDGAVYIADYSTIFRRDTNTHYNDPSKWYNLVFAFDATANSTRLFIDGVEKTNWTVQNGLSNTDYAVNKPALHQLFQTHNNFANGDGYYAEVAFIDGQSLDSSSFGQFNAITGNWEPKDLSGLDYSGANSFWLSDGIATGVDSSGNGNNWTVNDNGGSGIVTLSTDTPSTVYATLNPLDKNLTPTYSNGNLTVTVNATNETASSGLYFDTSDPDGYYIEMTKDAHTANGPVMGFQLRADGSQLIRAGDGAIDAGVFATSNGAPQKRQNSINSAIIGAPASTSVGTVFMFAFKGGNFWFGDTTNGWYESGDPSTGANPMYSNLEGRYSFNIGNTAANTVTVTMNFGGSTYVNEAPTGFKALSTANLAKVEDKLSNHFETLLYTGNGTSQTITGTDWGGDDQLVWIKSRSTSASHRIGDSVRGPDKMLFTDLTLAEDVGFNEIVGFNNNGFDISTGAGTNNNGANYVAWRFRAGTSTANTAGTISSTVSANTTSGFSIVKYTGNGTAGATIGHGLGKSPEMIIVKRLDVADNWRVYTKKYGKDAVFTLNTTTAVATGLTGFWGNQEPDTSVFSVGTDTSLNTSGGQYIAYIFTDSDFIDIGSYTGNGSTDGTFVNMGGAPNFVLRKSTTSGYSWTLHDKIRNPYNPAGKELAANGSGAEVDSSNYYIDFMSTGLKNRTATGDNTSGHTIVYLAFKDPFQTKEIDTSPYYAVSFDERTTFKIWDTTNTSWKAIVKKFNTTWQYLNASSTWTNCTTNTMNACLSESFAIKGNTMTGATMEAITETQWQSVGGVNLTTTAINVATGLKTGKVTVTPKVDNIKFNFTPRVAAAVTSCYANTKACTITNGVGLQEWNSSTETWGSCGIVNCNSGYAQSGNSCVSASSLIFNGSNKYLSRTPAGAGDQKTWTLSTWIKRSKLGTSQAIFGAGTPSSGNKYFEVTLHTDNKIVVTDSTWGVSTSFGGKTAGTFTDVGSWYHVVLAMDTVNSTYNLYVNGVLQNMVLYSVATYPTANYNTAMSSATQQAVGSFGGVSGYFDGYQSDIYFVDGQALNPTSFGQTNATNNKWEPINYTGTYGTNGFHLDFTDNSSAAALGTDSSGNGNDFTVNNFATTDKSSDSPSNNYATLNPLNIASGRATLSNGNLSGNAGGDTGNHKSAAATILIPNTGKWYWEWKSGGSYSAWSEYGGIWPVNKAGQPSVPANGRGVGLDYPDTYSIQSINGNKVNNAGSVAYSSAFIAGDIMGAGYDADTGTLKYWKNGVDQGVAFTGIDTSLTWSVVMTSLASTTYTMHFAEADMVYGLPTGYKTLSTKNLPVSTISKSNNYFETITYTGTGATQTITGTDWGGADQLVWVRERDVYGHITVFDTIRGATKALYTSSTSAESTLPLTLTAFNNNGFTVGADINDLVNGNGHPIVAWRWRAGDSQVVNNDGTISSTVSANPTSGFSIVKYTGNEVSGSTVGHGLGVVPDMLMVKRLTGAEGWFVYNKNLNGGVAPQNEYLRLDRTDASANNAVMPWANTAPTSSVFSLGLSPANNSGEMIAYVWLEVEGFSKFGSFTNNNATDGPFVYTGFKPAYVMMKTYSAGTSSWYVYDNKRSPENPVNEYLNTDTSSAEGGANHDIDFLSNGFKLRTNLDPNYSSYSTIYMAFAEEPLSDN